MFTKNTKQELFIKVAHGSVWFKPDTEQRVIALMCLQCSAMRSAYQAGMKYEMKGNDVKQYVKKNYMGRLNQRYIADACTMARRFASHKNVCFGGKANWDKMVSGVITKKEWLDARNNQLYSRGDRTHNGNPNIRISSNKIYIKDPSCKSEWLEGSLFIPKKFDIDLDCYSVRLLRKSGKFHVVVSWWAETPMSQVGPGAIGVDCNPDGVAIVEINSIGNILKHRYIRKPRICNAKKNKRTHDINLLAKQVVDCATAANKPIVVEELNFKSKDKTRMHSSKKFPTFAFRRMLNAVKQRSLKYGIPVIVINPMYTSILGVLKYKRMYCLCRHTAAAFVIARRGIGLLERCDFTVTETRSRKQQLNLEGRSCSVFLSRASFNQMHRFLKPEKSALTAPSLALSPKLSKNDSLGEIPIGESSLITSQTRLG